jgi:polar amino acid transport system permease protein
VGHTDVVGARGKRGDDGSQQPFAARGASCDRPEKAAARMNYIWDFAILTKYSRLFWSGIAWTMAYTVGTVLLGTFIGLLVGILRLKKWRVLDWFLVGYVELFRCTPLLVQIIWFYYAFPVVIGVNIGPNVAATAVLSLYGGAFYAEIFRGGIQSLERGQWDAARALGLRPWLVLRLVILPQAVKRMLPPFVNQSITQLKNTSLVSVIAVPDLVYNATLINADTYRPLEVYTVVAIIYFAILFPATVFAQRLEKRMSADTA